MAYCTHDEVEKLVGPENFRQMLDDDRDGEEDSGLFDTLAEAASSGVDAYVGAQYPLPFATVPSFARLAARVLCCESLYKRRGVSKDANPFAGEADAIRKRLERIMDGEADLDFVQDAAGAGVEADTEPSKLAQQDGRMMF